jgi:hypothetical protein
VIGVRIACKQKPRLTWVLHHAEAYFFCLMLCLIARLSRFRFLIRDLISISGRACSGFSVRLAVWPNPRSGPARGLTQPGPGTRPLVPHPHARPLSLSHFFSSATTSLSLSFISLPPLSVLPLPSSLRAPSPSNPLRATLPGALPARP